jgi:hypothetical protein
MQTIAEFTVNLNAREYLQHFWFNKSIYESFLSTKLEDKNIAIDDWSNLGNTQTRQVKSAHPSKISFPGLPSHTNSKKQQTLIIENEKDACAARIDEITEFSGIPYSDFFVVSTKTMIIDKESSSCVISVSAEVVFKKYTWLKSTIESNTRSELIGVYEQYHEFVLENAAKFTSSSKLKSSSSIDDRSVDAHRQSVTLSRRLSDSKGLATNDDDDSEFYDCEEGTILIDDNVVSTLSKRIESFHNNHHYRLLLFEDPSNGEEQIYTIREFSINCVETIFVIIEALWHIVRRVYLKEMKLLFQTSMLEVKQKIIDSFIPGRYEKFFTSPDLYGPILAVLLLPQVLLLSLSKHGCNQFSLLGNTSVMSIFTWLGLSTLYRLLGFAILPQLKFKNCLCITGYSFYYWNLAILLYYPLDSWTNSFSSTIPLVIFGLPTAFSQGYIFLQAGVVHNPKVESKKSSQHFSSSMLWLFPKLLCFLLVLLTHYQFLWYFLRVFLPGKSQVCELARLMNPVKYTDILIQKDVVKYAQSLINNKH